MPSRNVVKIDIAQSFYHIYARGASKQVVFLDPSDYAYFLRIFARYLSCQPVSDKAGQLYPHYRGKVLLLAYCLMPNHFHLLIYQEEAQTMAALMRSIMTSYSRYFNRKYKRSGSLFESRYKASRIDNQHYLEHISRYIHLNPRHWRYYPYSSFHFYMQQTPEWLQNEQILALFESKKAYESFVEDYEGHKIITDTLKKELANA